MDQASLDFGQPTDVMGFGQLSGEISNVDAPPPPKPRKRPRRLTPEEKAVMLEKRKKAIPEILGPLVEISVENGIYICVTCGFSTGSHYKENWRRVQIIKMHIRTKHLNAYRCHLCEKKFLSNKGYQLHLRTMHPPEDLTSLHLCNICGKSVSDIDAHLWHHKTPEEKEQVIQSGKGFALLPCDRCGKEFVGFDKLLAHQSIGNRCKGTGPRKYPVVAKTRKREFRTINRRKFHPTDRGRPALPDFVQKTSARTQI